MLQMECHKNLLQREGYKYILQVTSLLEIPFLVQGGLDLEYYLNGIQILLCFWVREVITVKKLKQDLSLYFLGRNVDFTTHQNKHCQRHNGPEG